MENLVVKFQPALIFFGSHIFGSYLAYTKKLESFRHPAYKGDSLTLISYLYSSIQSISICCCCTSCLFRSFKHVNSALNYRASLCL